uniref:hypothetical protein n=1 Tax=Pseudomonadota TaxID=1224 RepID=UPI004048A28F
MFTVWSTFLSEQVFLSDIWDWANANSGGLALIGLLVIPASFFFAFIGRHGQGVALEKMLRDPASWDVLAARYRQGRSAAYFGALERTLRFAARWYGDRLLSWRAYGVSLAIAYFYPFIALVLGWGLFNIWAPAGVEMFKDTARGFERGWRLAVFIFGLSAAVYIAKNVENFSHFIVARLFKEVDTPNTRTGAGAVAVAAAVVAAAAAAGAGAVVAAAAGAGAAAVAAAFAAAAAVVGNFEVSAIIFLIYFILPLLNAAADMVSLAITRGFLAKVYQQRPAVWVIIGQMVLDLVLAAVCLAALIASLIAVLSIWALFSPATAPFDWLTYWQRVKADPREGVALYAMAVTTLIPTAFHLIAGLGAVWSQKSRVLLPVAHSLAAQPKDKPFAEVDIDEMMRGIGHATLWGYFWAGLVVLVLFAALLRASYAVLF